MKHNYAIGVDAGGSHFCSAAIDTVTGDIIGNPFTTPINSQAGASEILDALEANIMHTMAVSGIKSLKGIGIAFPGPFDYDTGVSKVEGVKKYENIFGLDIASSLSQRFGGCAFDDMKFLNDAAAFVLGECFKGAAKGADRVVGITLGTGVGSGFVSGLRLVETGEDIPDRGWIYNLPFEDGIADEAFSTRWICGRFHELTGLTVTTAKEVVDLYDTYREVGILFAEYGKRLAAFISPILTRFHADMIVIGGNISRAWPLFAKEVENGIMEHRCGVKIRVSELWDIAAVIGAAAMFADKKPK